MSSLAKFEFEGNQVRIVTINGEPWFVAKDVCKALGLANSGDALSRLDDDEKTQLSHDSIIGLTDNPNTVRLSAVTESGMYALVLSSRKPEAKPFRKWVTSEVIPSIRKTGKYEVEQPIAPTDHQLPATYIEALEALLESEKEKEQLRVQNELQAAQIDDLEEDVEKYSSLADESFTHSSIVRIAKFNGVNETAFKWRVLKAATKVAKLEIKRAPCPRFGEKLLYPHQAWAIAYPTAKLLENPDSAIVLSD